MDIAKTKKCSHCHKTDKIRGLLCNNCKKLFYIKNPMPDKIKAEIIKEEPK